MVVWHGAKLVRHSTSCKPAVSENYTCLQRLCQHDAYKQNCMASADVLLSGALQVHEAAQRQQTCCSLELCRCRRLLSANRCVGMRGTAGAQGCSAPAAVLLSGALQVQETAQRQQVCGYARHCRCTRLLSASRCVCMRDPASAEDWLKPAAVLLCIALQVQLFSCKRLPSANRRVALCPG